MKCRGETCLFIDFLSSRIHFPKTHRCLCVSKNKDGFRADLKRPLALVLEMMLPRSQRDGRGCHSSPVSCLLLCDRHHGTTNIIDVDGCWSCGLSCSYATEMVFGELQLLRSSLGYLTYCCSPIITNLLPSINTCQVSERNRASSES